VTRRPDALSQFAQALGEALSVVEEDDFCDVFSVRLRAALRQSVHVSHYPGAMSRWSQVMGAGRASLASWGLVATQGVLFVAIAVAPSSWGPSVPSLRLVGGVWCVAGSAGVVAAAWYLGRALTPVPEPNGAGMSARGIYAWVRHPMYTSVVIAALGVAAARGSFAAWLLVVALGAFFELKTRREERFLLIEYPGYGAYAERTGKFVPSLGKRRKPPISPE